MLMGGACDSLWLVPEERSATALAPRLPDPAAREPAIREQAAN
jgi:hypothetical protein